MAKYPVESDDNVGVIDALNYLLSGPISTGQNFSGFSSTSLSWLTGNIRPPYTVLDIPDGEHPIGYLYKTVTVLTTEKIDNTTIKCTYADTIDPPFLLGNGVYASGITGFNSVINNYGIVIGVIECTSTYCLIRLDRPYTPAISPASGGTLTYTMFPNRSYLGDSRINPTDCNAYAQVTSSTDRVFVSAQIDAITTVTTSAPNSVYVVISIQRYKAKLNTSPGQEQYVFVPDGILLSKSYQYDITSSGSLPRTEAVFSNIIDTPDPGYYWYVMTIEFQQNLPSTAEIILCELQVRSLSTQVVKQ